MQNYSSRRDLIRNGAMLTLFGAGALITYRSRLERWIIGGESGGSDLPAYVADIDYWQRTQRERLVTAFGAYDLDHDLATEVPITLGDWTGTERPQTNVEALILLDPEQYVHRLYQHSDGRFIWLSLIGGRSSKPFHPSDICYDVDGWRTELASRSIPLKMGGDLYGLWLNADKTMPEQESTTEHRVFYFYLLRRTARDHAQGIVLVKLTSPPYGTEEETLAMHGEFLQHLFRSAEAT